MMNTTDLSTEINSCIFVAWTQLQHQKQGYCFHNIMPQQSSSDDAHKSQMRISKDW